MTPPPAIRPAAASTAPSASVAPAWARSARFLKAASQRDSLPGGERPEIAFVGRSNAGKSTAIHTLAQHWRLACASRTPGRTRHIILFERACAANLSLALPPAFPEATGR